MCEKWGKNSMSCLQSKRESKVCIRSMGLRTRLSSLVSAIYYKEKQLFSCILPFKNKVCILLWGTLYAKKKRITFQPHDVCVIGQPVPLRTFSWAAFCSFLPLGEIKWVLCTSLVLYNPDFDCMFILQTDASNEALGRFYLRTLRTSNLMLKMEASSIEQKQNTLILSEQQRSPAVISLGTPLPSLLILTL